MEVDAFVMQKKTNNTCAYNPASEQRDLSKPRALTEETAVSFLCNQESSSLEEQLLFADISPPQPHF